MMLGDEDDVACAGFDEEICPGICTEALSGGVELRPEVRE